ncbi:MAG: NAD(P)-dependent oxidoreductase [Caulobacterales bacterium]
MAKRGAVLLLTGLPPIARQALDAHYDIIDDIGVVRADRSVKAIVTNGRRGVTAQEIATLPNLKLVLTIGVGFENVDVAALAARGVPLITGRGTNEDAVADHALALLLASARDLVRYDKFVRGGPRLEKLPSSLTNKTIGILGLGEIGLRIARRAEAFSMSIVYHNRRKRSDVPYEHYSDVKSLAEAADFLVVAAPGGVSTYHLVAHDVLTALGPHGRLINIGRGEIVDTNALISALENGVIAGAALDVFEGEPIAPPALAALPNVILTPHVAAASPERVAAMTNYLLAHLQQHLATPALTNLGART